ncbi:MAG: MFS transporter [Hyphomicrobiaceae bacterium]
MHSPMPLLARVFYGWYVVGAVLVITTAISGFFFYNLSILLAAFVAERGFPVGLASSATATFFIAAGLGGLLSGRLLERMDVRFVVTLGALLGTVALASVGTLTAPWQLYAFYVTLGAAHGIAGLVPMTTVIARWFNVHRSLALSIGTTGLSLGGIVVAPAVALAVTQHGLEATAPWMALALFLGVVPVALLALRRSPQAMGLAPDGLTRAEAAAAPPQPSISFHAAMRDGYFYVVSASYFFLLGTQVGSFAHLYRLASTRDGAETAALALGVMAATSTIGRLICGALLIKVPARAFALAMMAMQGAALALLAWAHSRLAIAVGVGVFGLTMGNSLMMHPLLLVERFGARDIGRIYSVSQVLTMGGLAAGPALIGLVYETSGGYEVPFLASATATLVGFAVLAGYGGSHRPMAPAAGLTPGRGGGGGGAPGA